MKALKSVVFVAGWVALAACAQTYPVKAIRVINPYTPGGGVDALFRPLAQKMSEGLKQQIVVDNRPGANGMIGMEAAAKAPPDGYTLVVSTTGALTMNVSVYKKIPFDPIKDFVPISNYAESAFILAAHPSVPAKNMKELIALAKARPDQLTYASFGVGSSAQLGMELLSMMAGIKMIHVPYKGSVPMVTDLIAGHVMLSLDSMQSIMPAIRDHRVRAIGIAAAKRSPAAPDIPTMAESGLPGFEVGSWYGLLAPAGTPREIIARLHSEVVKAVGSAEVRERFQSFGSEPLGSSPDEFAAQIKSDIAKWAKVAKTANVRAD
jgi:tripartite-type tricarboxylate transporter receptor subunit TctC